MSRLRVSSGTAGPSGSGRLPYAAIRTNPPPPDEWTLVNEYNIEKRDNFTDWQRRVAIHLEQMRNQLLNYSVFINMMDDEIDETRRQWRASSRQDNSEEDNNSSNQHTRDMMDSSSSSGVKTNNGMKEIKEIAQEQ